MKKFISFFLAAAVSLGMCACGENTGTAANTQRAENKQKKEAAVEKYGSDTLKLFNWGEYIGEDTIANFEKEFGVNVVADYYDSNEMMYTKLLAGDSYDVIVPSDYMIERLIAEDRLQPIDLSLIPNMENVCDSLKTREYDPDNTYSVPFFWGSVGLVYNKNNVDKAEIEEKGYEILRDEKYKGNIYIYDSERDAFMVALKALGYSMNTDNEDEINAAFEWLKSVNDTMEPAYVTDEVIDAMANENKDIAVVYSGDAAYILNENEDLGFVMPKEGTNIWSDAMVIPKNAENPKLAHEFMNYILTYDASYDNSITVGYSSSNKEVLEDLSAEDGEFYGNEAYLPREGYEKDEIFHDNEVLKKKLSDLWIKVKAAS